MRSIAAVVIVGLMAVSASACGSDPSNDEVVHIVATTTILGDVVTNVVGDAAEVEVLMPVGVDPHDFQPSSQQVAAIQRADLVVANGLGLEEGLQDVLEVAASDGVRVWEVGPDIDPLGYAETTEGDSHDDDHEVEDLDPHFWLDPLRVARAAILLGDQLAEVAPDPDWSAAAGAYGAELAVVDEDSIQALAVVAPSDRKLVTNHRSFGYFADRYGFEVIGTVIPGGATLANPSSAELASLVGAIEREQVPAIFTENVEPDVLATAVASEVGYDVAVVELYTGSLGEPGSDGDTLIKMLESNVARIVEALRKP
jgi:zinc/manganese transport system substrate-binding protein